MQWLLTAAYGDTSEPQVYETTIAAADADEAERVGRQVCVEDNGGDWPEDGQPGGIYELVDVFVRPDVGPAFDILRKAHDQGQISGDAADEARAFFASIDAYNAEQKRRGDAMRAAREEG